MRSTLFTRNLFFAGIILAASGILSAPLALAAGLPSATFHLVRNSGHYVPIERPKDLVEVVAEALGAAR